MREENKELSFSNMSRLLEVFGKDADKQVRTEYVTFCNETTVWDVDVFLYDFRQIRNLPPPDGYVVWTGPIVGAKSIGPGQCQTHYLTVNVIGEQADAGLLNLKHRQTGKVIATFNFNERTAAEGKYYRTMKWSIVDGKNENDKDIVIMTFSGTLSDGEIVKSERIIG